MDNQRDEILGPILTFIAAYAGLLALILLVAYFLTLLGITFLSAMLFSLGALYVWAATARPAWVFRTVRRIHWLGDIKDDLTARRILVGLAALMGLLGFAAALYL